MTPVFGTMRPAQGVTFAQLTPLDGEPHKYRVGNVAPLAEAVPATYGLAFGPLAKGPLPHPGDIVDVEYDSIPSAHDVLAAIGGGPQLLKDGKWYEDPHPPAPDEREVRWPVIAVGRLADQTLLFFAVDGRHPERAVGMTRPEFATLMQGFGVLDAIALDSGGSVTMVARTATDPAIIVRNRPSDDDGERFVGNGLFVYSTAPEEKMLAHSP
jgi:hypothetical protein